MTAVLVLEDGLVFWGEGFGATGTSVGELCFNTSMSGYQETLTDPSYAGQIITFTFPHIGNIGTNAQDIEAHTPAVRGLVVHSKLTQPSNWRAVYSLEKWLKTHRIIGMCGVDTRKLVHHIRTLGNSKAALSYSPHVVPDVSDLQQQARSWSGLEGLDLAKEVCCTQTYHWNETLWTHPNQPSTLPPPHLQKQPPHVVTVDYGVKKNILRHLTSIGCRVTVVPANATYSEILQHNPHAIFLSNGPGDPMATGTYAVPVIRDLIDSNIPIFGICLGHQMLALAAGGKTIKMHHGHHGSNHPVKNLHNNQVEITTQNHGFMVLPQSLPDSVEVTHTSLFDQTNEGLRFKNKPIFSVQYHPEASPGPHDSHYLFQHFRRIIHSHIEI